MAAVVASNANLIEDLVEILDIGISHNRLRGIDVAVEFLGDVVVPHSHRAVADVVVELRREEIDGAVDNPVKRVAIDLVVLPVAAGTWFHAIFSGRSVGGATHAGRRDAEAEPRLHRLDSLAKLGYKTIDILAAPVAIFAHRATCGGKLWVVVGRGIGSHAPLRIEIVVESDAIDVVFSCNLGAHIDNSLSSLGEGRVEDSLVGIRDEPFGVSGLVVELRLAVGVFVGVVTVTERVHPSIDFDTALVSLVDDESEGVESGSLSARTGKTGGIRLVTRLIISVAHGTHMEIDRCEVVGGNRVEHFDTCSALVLGVSLGEVFVGPVAEHRSIENGTMLVTFSPHREHSGKNHRKSEKILHELF